MLLPAAKPVFEPGSTSSTQGWRRAISAAEPSVLALSTTTTRSGAVVWVRNASSARSTVSPPL